MSVSNNPDFWRSQEVGKPKTLPNQAPDDKSSSKLGGSAAGDSSTPKSADKNTIDSYTSKTPLTDGLQAKQAAARRGRSTDNFDGAKVKINPRNQVGTGASGISETGGKNESSLGKDVAPPRASGARRGAVGNATGTSSAQKPNPTQKSTPAGAAAKPSPASSAGRDLANRITGKPTSPKQERPSAAASNKSAPEVLSKDTGKEAVKEGLKQGIKGAAKGAMTGGLQGAAAAGLAGAAAGASDKINEASDARKQAGTSRGPSNRDTILSSAGDSALKRGESALQNRLASKYGSAAAGGNAALTPEQAKSIAKASVTVAAEGGKVLAKRAAVSAGVVIAMAYGLVMTTVSSTSGPLAATVAAYAANSASCEADGSSSNGVASPGEKGTNDGLKPAAIKVREYINSQWGAKIADIYGVRQGANALDHADGRALDIMLADYKSTESSSLGHEIADYFVSHAKEYGIDYVIFDSKIWANGGSPDSSWTYSGNSQSYGPKDWAPYNLLPGASDNDTQQHRDHVHISVRKESGGTVLASSVNPLSTLEMSRASNISALTSMRVPMVSLSDINANPGQYDLVSDPTMRADQIKNAKTIIGMAKTVGFNKEGAVIGIMTSMAETNLRNLHHGDAAGPDSKGLFQQRTTMGWGTAEQVTNPAYAAQAFFLGTKDNPALQSVSGWKDMDPWMAAQKVQRSAFSDGRNYHDKYDAAMGLVDALYESSDPVPAIAGGPALEPDGSADTTTSTSGCSTSGGDGTIGAVAKGDTYPARNESYSRTDAGYAVQCADNVAGGCRGECVDWAAWKLVEYTGTYGTHKVSGMGNGGDWGANAKGKGIAVDMNPVAGDAVYWLPGVGGAGGYGHVGTVQAVNGDGSVVIEEYNFGGDTPATGGGRYHTRTINANEASGYIHFIDPNKSKEENKANLIGKGILVPGKGTWPRTTT